jgi:hypothetical protein
LPTKTAIKFKYFEMNTICEKVNPVLEGGGTREVDTLSMIVSMVPLGNVARGIPWLFSYFFIIA